MLKKLVIFITLLLSMFTQTAGAADDADTAEIIALEIRNLSTSVDRLTRLLYDQGQQEQQDVILRKLDIAVAYLNFRSRRIEMLERDLQNNQTMKTRLEDIIKQWEGRLEQIEEQERANNGNSSDDQLSRQEAQEQLKMLKQRLARTDAKIIDFDNRVIELRNQLDDVEAFVERHLEL
jgi:chromosome segregation ATPase